MPLEPAPPIADSRICDDERAKRPGRGARRLLLPIPEAEAVAEAEAERGRGDGDGCFCCCCCCCSCLSQGEREGERRRPLLPPRLISSDDGEVSDLGMEAAALPLRSTSTPSSPPPLDDGSRCSCCSSCCSPSSATAAASLIACCDLRTAGETARSGRGRSGGVGEGAREIEAETEVEVAEAEGGEGLSGEFLPRGGRLLLLFVAAFGGLGMTGRGRAWGARQAAAAAVAAAAAASVALAPSSSSAFNSSSSSCSAPSVPAALSACCSLASSRKAAKMSVGTRSRWPRSCSLEEEVFFPFFFFSEKVFEVFSSPFARHHQDSTLPLSLSLSFLTCLNSTPSRW